MVGQVNQSFCMLKSKKPMQCLKSPCVCLSVCLSVTNKHVRYFRTTGWILQDLAVFYRDRHSRPATHPQLEDNIENITARLEVLGGETEENFRYKFNEY